MDKGIIKFSSERDYEFILLLVPLTLFVYFLCKIVIVVSAVDALFIILFCSIRQNGATFGPDRVQLKFGLFSRSARTIEYQQILSIQFNVYLALAPVAGENIKIIYIINGVNSEVYVPVGGAEPDKFEKLKQLLDRKGIPYWNEKEE
jgi:hypothetical protein